MSCFLRNTRISAGLLALALTAAIFTACTNARQSEIEQGKAAYRAKEYETAVKHYRTAAEQGDAEAQYLLGQCCMKGKGIPVGKRPSLNWMQGETETAVDKIQAVEWFRKAAAQGHPKALASLGMFYELEDAVVTEKEAEECFEKAVPGLRREAEQGDAESQRLLAGCLLSGCGAKRDIEEGIQWLRKSAEQGDPVSQMELGAACAEGLGTKKDEAEADKWFRKAEAKIREAAEEGDPEAQYLLGSYYYEGLGDVRKDLKTAKEWFIRAARQGEVPAMVQLEYDPKLKGEH